MGYLRANKYDMRRQLRAGLQQWLRSGLENGVNPDLEDIVMATDPENGLKQLYGLHLQRGEWTSAADYLNMMGNTVGDINFVTVQSINLARLQSIGTTFEPSVGDLVNLESISSENSPAGNHAKALLSYFRGDHFPAELELGVSNPIGIGGGGNNHVGSEVVIYPNPASTSILLSHLPYAEEVGSIQLTNQLGQVLKKNDFSQTSTIEIDIADLRDGLYFLIITTPQGLRFSKQIAVQH